METSSPPEPGDRTHPDPHDPPHDPQEDTMDTDPQPGTPPPAEPSTDPTSTWPATTEPVTTERDRRGPRVGTVVWGLVIAAIGVGILALAAGLVFDVQLALIALVAAAGLALLVGSLITGLRRSGR